MSERKVLGQKLREIEIVLHEHRRIAAVTNAIIEDKREYLIDRWTRLDLEGRINQLRAQIRMMKEKRKEKQRKTRMR